jgi:hypothetical protein
MRYKKIENYPFAGGTTVKLSKTLEGRTFCIDVCWGPKEARDWTARRLRNCRQYLREFILDEEPKKLLTSQVKACRVLFMGE